MGVYELVLALGGEKFRPMEAGWGGGRVGLMFESAMFRVAGGGPAESLGTEKNLAARQYCPAENFSVARLLIFF